MKKTNMIPYDQVSCFQSELILALDKWQGKTLCRGGLEEQELVPANIWQQTQLLCPQIGSYHLENDQ